MTENPQLPPEYLEQIRMATVVETKFDRASLPADKVQPIGELSPKGIVTLRYKLMVDGGCNFLNLEPEHLQSLKETKFRANLTEGRGPGMVAVMGEEKVKVLRVWCKEKSEGWKRLKKTGGEPIEGSEGRGLQQLSADIVTLATGKLSNEETKELLARMNKHIAKGYFQEAETPEEKGEIRVRFDIDEDLPKTLASVPPGTVIELYHFLTGKK